MMMNLNKKGVKRGLKALLFCTLGLTEQVTPGTVLATGLGTGATVGVAKKVKSTMDGSSATTEDIANQGNTTATDWAQ